MTDAEILVLLANQNRFTACFAVAGFFACMGWKLYRKEGAIEKHLSSLFQAALGCSGISSSIFLMYNALFVPGALKHMGEVPLNLCVACCSAVYVSVCGLAMAFKPDDTQVPPVQ